MASRETLTQALIEQGLRELGVKENIQLEVHSSLKSFGHVEGGAVAVIAALMNTVTDKGSIVMPSFLLSPKMELTKLDVEFGLKCKIRICSPDSDERSGMGIIADAFRKMPGVVTGDGLFRVSAWGRDKEMNRDTGFGNLIANDGWALLLGVDIYSLSSMHYVEGELPQEVKDIFKPSEQVLKLYPPDKWFVETGEPNVKAWYTIQNEAYERGYIKDGMIGNSKCMFFKISDVVNLYRDALLKDPLGLYGLRLH